MITDFTNISENNLDNIVLVYINKYDDLKRFIFGLTSTRHLKDIIFIIDDEAAVNDDKAEVTEEGAELHTSRICPDYSSTS